MGTDSCQNHHLGVAVSGRMRVEASDGSLLEVGRGDAYRAGTAAIECGKISERDRFFTSAQEKEIAAGFRQISDGKLVDVCALLGNKYDIGQLRIFRAFAAREVL